MLSPVTSRERSERRVAAGVGPRGSKKRCRRARDQSWDDGLVSFVPEIHCVELLQFRDGELTAPSHTPGELGLQAVGDSPQLTTLIASLVPRVSKRVMNRVRPD